MPATDGVIERRFLRLTPRWTPMVPHPEQARFFWHPARFKVNPSGRRSGKTELAKRDGVLLLGRRQRTPVRIFYAAPSFGQAKDIFWDDLQALIPDSWKARVNHTDLEIRTHWGSIARVFGFDRPRRIEGVPWTKGYIDEFADCPPGCFDRNVRPALATRGMEGGCVVLGVPDEVGRNQSEYEQLWEKGLQYPRYPEIASFHWNSADILAAAEISALRGSMDGLAYEQEMGGRFVTSGGKATPDFRMELHAREDYTVYAPTLTLDVAIDFGVNPAVSLLCQTYRGMVWVLDEIVLRDASTDLMAIEILDRIQTRGYSTHRMRVFGDAAGGFRHSPTGQTDYEILRQHFRGLNVEWENPRGNPPVKDTLNNVRRFMRTADNRVHLHINPRCRTLINDCKTAPWPSDLREFHALACLRYYCHGVASGGTTYTTTPLTLPNLASAAYMENPDAFRR